MKGKKIIILALVLIFATFPVFFGFNEHGNNRFFDDQTFHHLTMRTLGQTPYGGADIGEVLETIKHIRSGDPESWYVSWKNTADRITDLASNSHDPISQGRALLRAHNYYRTAEFLLAPDDPRRKETWQRNIAAFYSGLKMLNVDYERLVVPYENGHLNALYFPAKVNFDDNGSKNDIDKRLQAEKPLIIACGGVDSTMEELYFSIVAGARERNYPVLIFEGPGQGSILREQGMTFTPEWEYPTKAVLDHFLVSHRSPPSIVLVGMSMGGYLAPRAAAFDERITGVVAFDVLFDVGAAIKAQSAGSSLVVALHEQQMDTVANLLIRTKMALSPGIRWGVNNTKWVAGVKSYSETAQAFDQYTLKSVAHLIKGDVLILVGAEDHLVPSDQTALFKAGLSGAKSVTTVIYDSESGGKEHCQDGAVTLWQLTFFDWVHQKFEG